MWPYRPLVVFNDSEMVQQLYTTVNKKVDRDEKANHLFEVLMSKTIAFAPEGPTWNLHKKAIMPLFGR